MNQGRRRRSRQDAHAAYHRPMQEEAPNDAPAWEEMTEQTPPQPSWDEDTVWDDEPVVPQYDADDYFVPEHETRQIIATNRTIRLSCTLAACSALFALFLCFAEQESRAIRRFAVQSAALRVTALLIGAVCALISLSLGSIPLMGFVVSLMCWLAFVGAAVVLMVIRIRMMLFAWRGVSFRLPLMDAWLESKFK